MTPIDGAMKFVPKIALFFDYLFLKYQIYCRYLVIPDQYSNISSNNTINITTNKTHLLLIPVKILNFCFPVKVYVRQHHY